MLSLEEVTLRNFYSVGNVTQSVKIIDGETTLIVGDNQDCGDDESGSIRNGVGKAQPLSAKIRVKNGWKTMGEIGVGDIVHTPEGTTSVVLGKYPQGKRKVYTIKTKDGKVTEACKEHLWQLADGKIVNTQELYKLLKSGKVYLPVSTPIMDNILAFDIDPYFFGVFISGFQHNNTEYPYMIETYDHDIMTRILEKDIDGIDVTASAIMIDGNVSKVIDQYFNTNKKSLSAYVHTLDYDTKFQILQGICDNLSDPNDYSSINIYLSNKNLARDIRELVWSIGGTCEIKHKVKFSKDVDGYYTENNIILTIRHNNISDIHTYDKYDLTDTVVHNEVVSIALKGTEDVCCIKVSSDNHLYITDDYIPTHNTTIINAISYALYGTTITRPKRKASVINYFNGKGMLVTLKFSVNGDRYYIERGQKPDVMKFVSIDSNGNEKEVMQQGSNANTDAEIEKVIGISHLLMKYVILMSTYSTPFMAEEAAKQRAIIEELLGIGELSIKAARITDKERDLKIDIEKENVRIQTTIESNTRVERTVSDLVLKERQWNTNQLSKISKLESEYDNINAIDIKAEIEKHNKNITIKETNNIIKLLESEKNSLSSKLLRYDNDLVKLNNNLNLIEHKSQCFTCNQDLTVALADEQKVKIISSVGDILTKIDTESRLLNEIDKEMSKYTKANVEQTIYRSLDEAHNHERTIGLIYQELTQERLRECPYTEQRIVMEQSDYSIMEVDYTKLESLENTAKHYKFLKKLLTHKDSFLRKTIITQSLSYLNERLAYYLEKLRLPHHVTFDANLSFDIRHMGIDTDYTMLSRGEQNRVTYALNLAFRDIFELTRYRINALFVDELLDFGVDSSGAIAGLQILKELSYTNGTATFLVTHKEELMERVPNWIYVKKENGFTTYEVKYD